MTYYEIPTVPDEDGASNNSTLTQNSRCLDTIASSDIVSVENSRKEKEKETNKWLADSVKVTLDGDNNENTFTEEGMTAKNKVTLVDVKRHRMISTKCAVQARRRSAMGRISVQRDVRSSFKESVQDPTSSWIASEIFTIAGVQASGMLLKMGDGEETLTEGTSEATYEEIDSVIGDYLDEIKVTDWVEL
jgi:hypothetical protein